MNTPPVAAPAPETRKSYTLQDIATHSGLHYTSVCRGLATLQREGSAVIEVNGYAKRVKKALDELGITPDDVVKKKAVKTASPMPTPKREKSDGLDEVRPIAALPYISVEEFEAAADPAPMMPTWDELPFEDLLAALRGRLPRNASLTITL